MGVYCSDKWVCRVLEYSSAGGLETELELKTDFWVPIFKDSDTEAKFRDSDLAFRTPELGLRQGMSPYKNLLSVNEKKKDEKIKITM